MPYYVEGVLWYLIFLDSIIYNVIAWTNVKWFTKTTHWITPYFPIKKAIGVLYIVLVLWVGSALYRMQILMFV